MAGRLAWMKIFGSILEHLIFLHGKIVYRNNFGFDRREIVRMTLNNPPNLPTHIFIYKLFWSFYILIDILIDISIDISIDMLIDISVLPMTSSTVSVSITFASDVVRCVFISGSPIPGGSTR